MPPLRQRRVGASPVPQLPPRVKSDSPRFGHLVVATQTRRRSAALLALALLASAASMSAQITRVANTSLTLPQNPQTFGYTTQNAFPALTFDQPLGIVSAPNETDRVFILEKTGRIQAITGLSSGTPVKQVFLDLSARVLTASEEGLLGLAFHPDFTTNHYFYVFYSLTATTSDGTGDHERVARFTAVPGGTNADILATEVPMISQLDPAANHNGGDMHFGPDGYLYISLGDGGGANDQYNNSQRIDKDYFSGLLRIDVDQLPGNLTPNAHPAVHPGTYKVPADNPFVGATSFNGLPVTPASVRTEFWAVGLRNPWRFSIDAPTGRIFVGDVGQSAREEVDLITKGGNYGWNYREGTIAGPRANPPAGATFIDPIWDTPDRSLSATVTGGVVYRGARFAQLYGLYVFGDYLDNNVFTMSFPASGPVQVTKIASVSNPAGIGVDPSNGDVLFASISTGVINRLVYNSTATGTPLPATLTATGAFTNLANLTPAAGIVEYAPNISFWSDFAQKQRWFSVPAVANKITFAAEGNWSFPAGTVWIKHFNLELTRGDPSTARRIETRFLVKTAAGVYGVTYRWTADQTEAILVPEEAASEGIDINDGGVIHTQVWGYPSRSQCLQCHTPVAGYALSFNTPQLNGTHAYASGPANQLAALAAAGYFNTATIPDPATLRALAPATDPSATLEYKVRSFLAANCVQCHQPGGEAQGLWDARISTPTASAGLVNGALVDNAGDSANRVITPGDLLHSMLLTRISSRGANQMPPLASYEVDDADVAMVSAWIHAFRFADDFDADGGSDLLWQNSSTGERTFWLMNGAGYRAGASLGLVPTSWSIAGTGDFNGDGQPDILWENPATGERVVWLMDGLTFRSGVYLGVIPTNWSIAGTGDLNGDGQTDIVWQNTTTGERVVWFMDGTTFLSGAYFGVVPTSWSIAGIGDFNGDGKPDLLWQNTTTGERFVWLMDGTTYLSGVSLGVVPTSWSIAGIGDFNGDGRPDLLWQNTTTGERFVWLMNGTSFLAGVPLGVVPTVWSIRN